LFLPIGPRIAAGTAFGQLRIGNWSRIHPNLMERSFSENFLSERTWFQYVIPPLLQRVQPGGVYMGVGPEQNSPIFLCSIQNWRLSSIYAVKT
jgi:hypothetical protein